MGGWGVGGWMRCWASRLVPITTQRAMHCGYDLPPVHEDDLRTARTFVERACGWQVKAYHSAVASVQISDSVDHFRAMPKVCAKTGVHTRDTLTIKGRAAPTWSGVMLLFGFLPWAVAGLASSKPYTVVVPMRSAVWRRYRSWRRAGAWVAGAGIGLTLVAAALGRANPFLLLAPAAIGVFVLVGNEWFNAVGVRLAQNGGLVLTRVHPNFTAAMAESRVPSGDADIDDTTQSHRP